jgi:hypothetical protein
MKSTIGRTIKVHKVTFIKGSLIEGKPQFSEPETITLYGEQDTNAITKAVKNTAGTTLFMVTATETTEELYEMTVEEFMKYAKPVVKEEAPKAPTPDAKGTDTGK